MKPGPELDAIVAEKVMGWDVTRPPRPDGHEVIFAKEPDGTHHSIKDIPAMTILWSPSTDIKAAWGVVEKLSGEYLWDIQIGGGTGIVGQVQLERYVHSGRDGGGLWELAVESTEGESIHHAICLAALRAANYHI